jgi:hypothetical protein
LSGSLFTREQASVSAALRRYLDPDDKLGKLLTRMNLGLKQDGFSVTGEELLAFAEGRAYLSSPVMDELRLFLSDIEKDQASRALEMRDKHYTDREINVLP